MEIAGLSYGDNYKERGLDSREGGRRGAGVESSTEAEPLLQEEKVASQVSLKLMTDALWREKVGASVKNHRPGIPGSISFNQ